MVLFAMTEPLDELSSHIKRWAKELELQDCAITDTDLGEHETHLLNWLSNGFPVSYTHLTLLTIYSV